MKCTPLVLLSVLCAAPLLADAGPHVIPAGSLISCTISEPKMSSKNTAIGDPVLCRVSYSERYGRSVLPYNSYLVGRFEDYKDPGHFVGKGWMQLKFDRMVIEPDTVIPVDARVVDVPGYKVDNQGRILGKGHAARDIALWSIPILWPVDLMMLPMRGPRPVLKEETRVMLKVMDDMEVPDTEHPYQDQYGLSHRQPIAQNEPPPPPGPSYPEDAPDPMDEGPQQYAPPQTYSYAPPPPPPVYAYAPPPPVYAYAPPVVVAPGYMAYGGVGVGVAIAPRAYAYGPRAYGGYGYAPRAGYPAGPRPYGGYAAPRGYGYGAQRGVGMAYGGGAARGGVVARGYAR